MMHEEIVSKEPVPRMTNILIVQDQQLSRECLGLALAEIAWINVLGSISSRKDALQTVRELQPEIVLIDWDLSAESSMELTKQITASCPQTKVLIVEMAEEYRDLQESLVAGAKGYVLKSSSLNDLITVIESVANGEIGFCPQIAYAMFSQLSQLAGVKRRRELIQSMSLTAREMEILQMIAEGLSNKQIADRLCLSLYTIKNHVHKMLEKMQAQDRRAAVAHAQAKHWLE